MELGLSLGDASKPFRFMEKSNHNHNQVIVNNNNNSNLGFCMALSIGSAAAGGGGGGKSEKKQDKEKTINDSDDGEEDDDGDDERERAVVSLDHHPPRVQLNLLPLAPVPLNHLSPPPPPHSSPWPISNNGQIGVMTRGFDVNRLPAASTLSEDVEEGGAALSSSPSRNSGASSFQMDLCMYSGGGGGGGGGSGNNKRESNELVGEGENGERASSRASDDDENGSTRKKLRLSKDQSAFLEESFKEHNTLNPKQKLALAKQLNLRPRQVEVWFQNRRARTKLKQTEVDCEYLKRCCETLTDENRRLQKELQELRALKSSNSNPFYMQLPATTLTMCPSCERVATTTTTASTTTTTTATPNNNNNNNTNHPPATTNNSKQTPFSLSRPRFYPFSHSSQQQSTTHNIHHPNQSKAS